MAETGADVRYRKRVAQYLTSELGRNTSDAVAIVLLGLKPSAIAMPEEPSAARLHAVRSFLEASRPDNQQTVASSGTHFVESAPLDTAVA